MTIGGFYLGQPYGIGDTTLVSPAEIVQHTNAVDMDTSAIQLLIEDAEQEVIERFGEHVTQVDDLEGDGPLLFLKRRAASITTITERWYASVAPVTLDASDYQLRQRGWALERLSTGSHSQLAIMVDEFSIASTWGKFVVVDYVPVDDTRRRKRVIIDLVRLAIRHTGMKSMRDGDHAESAYDDYQGEREQILSALDSSLRSMA